MAKPGIVAPAQSKAGLSGLCLRQRTEGPHPACPEHFWRDSSRQRCGGIAGRYNYGVAVPRSGGTGLF